MSIERLSVYLVIHANELNLNLDLSELICYFCNIICYHKEVI